MNNVKKWMIAICAVCAVVLLLTSVSGKKGAAYRSIGSTYNKFLFIPAKSAHFVIPFKSSYTGPLTLIDEKGNVLSSNKYIISVDGKKTGASFSVKGKRAVHVAIRCTGQVNPGKQYIRVKGGGPLVTHVYFKHHVNPLLAWLSWIITLTSIVALIWFSFLQRLIYPKFKSAQKTIFVPNEAPLIVKLTGARMVIISAEKQKQSFWDALIRGTVIYKFHPSFTSPIAMRPLKGGRILVKADSAMYRVSPNPMPLVGSAVIDHVNLNKQITIN
jgi:hypothetical protein